MEADLTFEQLYVDLISAQSEILPEQYFTLAEFRTDTGFSDWIAKDRLRKSVETGKLKSRLATINGRHLRIWWFVEQTAAE